jgi:hypothetical protein
VPRLFDAALVSPGLHALQHLSFLATALLFWWPVLGPTARRQPGAALLSLFTTMLHTAALGALLALAASPWYAAYAATAPAAGWDPLADQQLGGLIMWVPAGTGYVAAALAIAARCLRLGLGVTLSPGPSEAPVLGRRPSVGPGEQRSYHRGPGGPPARPPRAPSPAAREPAATLERRAATPPNTAAAALPSRGRLLD